MNHLRSFFNLTKSFSHDKLSLQIDLEFFLRSYQIPQNELVLQEIDTSFHNLYPLSEKNYPNFPMSPHLQIQIGTMASNTLTRR